MRKVEDASDKAVTKVFAGTSKASSNSAPKSSQTKLDLWSKFSDKTEPKKQMKTADDPYSGKLFKTKKVQQCCLFNLLIQKKNMF